MGQKDLLIQKSTITQSQDLQMVHDNIGRLLSNAEILVALNNVKNKNFPPPGFKYRFNFYKIRDVNDWNIDELRKALCQKIYLTKMSFEDYIKDYCQNDPNKFKYNKKFGKKELFNHLNYLGSFVCDKDKELFKEILNIFEPKPSKIDKIYGDLKKVESKTPFNLRDVCHYGPGLSHYNECRKEIASKKALENQTVDCEFNIDQENNSDVNMNNYKRYAEFEKNRILYNESMKYLISYCS